MARHFGLRRLWRTVGGVGLSVAMFLTMLSGGIPASAAAVTSTVGTGSISGTVSGAAGVDVSKVLVVAMPENGLLDSRSVQTTADGKYTLKGVVAADYRIEFGGHLSGGYDTWYAGPTDTAPTQATASVVTVGANQAVTGINGTVPLGATVSGTVTVPAGLSDTRVSAVAWPDDPTSTFNTILFRDSDSSGRYTIPGLAPGSYTICFIPSDDGALRPLCGGGIKDGGPRIAVVGTEQITGTDFTLVRSSSIAGKITLPAGATTSGLAVSARSAPYYYPTGRGTISSDGSYTITGLAPGNYLVKVAAEAEVSGLVDRWYGVTADSGSATTVVAPPQESATGVNFTLAQAPVFKDVPTEAQFFTEITWLAARGVTTGFPDGTYRPVDSIHRDAMAAFLYRAAGMPVFTPPAKSPFRDVPTSSPFYKEITWLKSTGITTGYPDGTFRPLGSVNRDAMAAFLYRMTSEPYCRRLPSEYSSFKDKPAKSLFHDQVEWMACTGISTGYPDGTYRPLEPVNRPGFNGGC